MENLLISASEESFTYKWSKGTIVISLALFVRVTRSSAACSVVHLCESDGSEGIMYGLYYFIICVKMDVCHL